MVSQLLFDKDSYFKGKSYVATCLNIKEHVNQDIFFLIEK